MNPVSRKDFQVELLLHNSNPLYESYAHYYQIFWKISKKTWVDLKWFEEQKKVLVGYLDV